MCPEIISGNAQLRSLLLPLGNRVAQIYAVTSEWPKLLLGVLTCQTGVRCLLSGAGGPLPREATGVCRRDSQVSLEERARTGVVQQAGAERSPAARLLPGLPCGAAPGWLLRASRGRDKVGKALALAAPEQAPPHKCKCSAAWMPVCYTAKIAVGVSWSPARAHKTQPESYLTNERLLALNAQFSGLW